MYMKRLLIKIPAAASNIRQGPKKCGPCLFVTENNYIEWPTLQIFIDIQGTRIIM